jgi:hypothetical protein
MQVLNIELPMASELPYDRYELARSVESILEILMALDEEAVEKWIREKHPIGINFQQRIAR